jgi:hypothetical protein
MIVRCERVILSPLAGPGLSLAEHPPESRQRENLKNEVSFFHFVQFSIFKPLILWNSFTLLVTNIPS